MKIPNFKFALREDLQQLCAIYNSKLPLLADGPKPLIELDFLPTQSDPDATGYDVRCAVIDGVILNPGHYIKIPLGIRMFAPQGWWLQLAPRSSTFVKLNLHPLYGVIDETFENEMVFVGQYLPDQASIYHSTQQKVISFGDRIGQLIPVLRQHMTVSTVTALDYEKLTANRQGHRGAGGFGSSGIK